LSPNHLLGSVASELSADPEITSPLEFGVPFLDFALSEQAKMAHIVSVDYFNQEVLLAPAEGVGSSSEPKPRKP
jgi:hypothetical protein